MRIRRLGYWSRFPFRPPGDLPNPVEPISLMSPPLAGRFFATTTTWEAISVRENSVTYRFKMQISGPTPRDPRSRTWPCVELREELSQHQFSSVQLSYVWHFATPWTAAHQASLSITKCQSLLKLMSIQLVVPSNHLICNLLPLPSIFPSIRIFSSESAVCIKWLKYWSFSLSISP